MLFDVDVSEEPVFRAMLVRSVDTLSMGGVWT